MRSSLSPPPSFTARAETGLVFECTHLDKETKKCKIHKKRSGICRRYPQEELFLMGGTLAENCGYRLEPIESFEEVFKKVSKKTLKKQNIIR